MPIHKNQRVGVFIDVQNLYYSAKQFYNSKVNFAHILKKAVAGRSLIRAIAYVIKADIKEEHNFFEALEKIGYDVRAKELQTFYTGAKKGDWDVGIAMDIMRMAGKLDVIVLVSGDGDFKDLLEHVKALGCRAEVIAFGKTASSRLTGEADQFFDLGKDLDKTLIKDKKYSQKHSNKSVPQKKGVENIPYQRPDGSFEKKVPGNKISSPRPKNTRPRKNTRSKSSSQRRPPRRDYNNKGYSSHEPSFMEKINMDQPDLTKALEPDDKKPAKKTSKPRKRAPAKKPPAKKTARKTTSKKPAAKKPARKKRAPKKSSSKK